MTTKTIATAVFFGALLWLETTRAWTTTTIIPFRGRCGFRGFSRRGKSRNFNLALRAKKRKGHHDSAFEKDENSGDKHAAVVDDFRRWSEASSSSSPSSALDRVGGLVYRTSVFSRDELAVIQNEIAAACKKNPLQAESSSSIALHRMGTTLHPTSDIVEILKTGSLHKLVERLTSGHQGGTSTTTTTWELSSNIPVEVRVYERVGAGMAWHVDDVLYDPPQVEVVWTLENSSDCVTMWKVAGSGANSHQNMSPQEENDNDDNVMMHSVETEPNSVILLTAGVAPHCVSSLTYGRRVILKCAFVEKGATFREGLHKNQFDNNNSKASRTKKKETNKHPQSKRRR